MARWQGWDSNPRDHNLANLSRPPAVYVGFEPTRPQPCKPEPSPHSMCVGLEPTRPQHRKPEPSPQSMWDSNPRSHSPEQSPRPPPR